MANTKFDLFQDIPEFNNWCRIEPVNKGWSADKKFYIEANDGKKLLLRLANISQLDKKKTEFATMVKVHQLGINMSEPISLGICDGGKLVYTLLSWLEGESAQEVLPSLNVKTQYDFGISAGQMLKKVHSIPAPDNQTGWESRMTHKVELKVIQYENCGHNVPNDKKIWQFIQKNMKYLKNRPQTLQHGDFHVGNLIITPQRKLGLIDFNRLDYGDPWEEFCRLAAFSRRVSIPFTRGQIDGYFDNQPPDLFFKLMALYTAIDAHFSIIWAIPFGEKEIEGSLERSKMNYEDYRGFETYIPVWYK
jgi:aminoglycoside phosphotransferase (APT) family kinase protein